MSTNPSGARIDESTSSAHDRVSDASGVLLLLLSAKVSLQAHAADSACIDSLTRCIGGIRKQYNLADCDLHGSHEADMDGILRLLEYVEGEVRETLRDSAAADEVRRCLALVANSRQVYRDRRRALQVFPQIALSMPKTALS
jgi:hypothetical protein